MRRSPTVGAGSGSIPLSDAVMRALTAVAEHTEDQFRSIALETLAEIGTLMPILASACLLTSSDHFQFSSTSILYLELKE